MALARDQTTAGLLAELDACADLIAGLTEADLAMETPFHGWPVRSVAGHMAGTITDALSGRTENLALLATAARQANERRDRTSREIADELRGARVAAATILHALDDQAWAQPVVADFPGTLGDGLEAIIYDLVGHRHDVTSTTKRAIAVHWDTLVACLSHAVFELARRGAGPITLALNGTVELVIGTGGGRRITGDPLEFVLAVSGRGESTRFGLTLNAALP